MIGSGVGELMIFRKTVRVSWRGPDEGP